GELVVFDLELLEGHRAKLPIAPGLVADSPELDAVRLAMAVGRPQPAHGRGLGTVAIGDPMGSRVRVAEARVDGDVGLDAQQPAQSHEFVRADVVWLHDAPGVVPARGTLVRIADGIGPFITGDIVASGKAVNAGTELPKCGNDLAPKTFNIVRRHQR